jgi:hypothetical protein
MEQTVTHGKFEVQLSLAWLLDFELDFQIEFEN